MNRWYNELNLMEKTALINIMFSSSANKYERSPEFEAGQCLKMHPYSTAQLCLPSIKPTAG